MTEQPRPSIGRIVHYTMNEQHTSDPEKLCAAAIVTAVTDERVSLRIFGPTGDQVRWNVPAEHLADKIEPGPSGRTEGTWHWPERVE